MFDNPSKRVLSLSDAIYRRLLLLYPAVHRREYGALMAAAFQDLSADRYRQAGMRGLVGLWARTLPDTVASAAIEHWDALRETFPQALLNWLAAAVAGLVFGPFYLAALASLLVRTGLGYEALSAMSIFFYVPYFLASAIFFSSAAGYLLVSALALALALGALIWGRSGHWGRWWMVIVLLAVIGFPWLHRYRPALVAAPGYEVQVLTLPGPLEGNVKTAQITLEVCPCRYELLGWSPDNQLYYRASCDSRSQLLRYDPGQPGRPSLAAALPPDLVQSGVTRGDVLEMVRAHDVWPRDAEPSVRSLLLEGMGYPSPDGRWMAAVVEHLYGPQDVVVLHSMAY
jgi:hypothetical protein